MKKKIIEIVGGVLNYLPWGEISSHTAEDIADRLIEHGVTFAEDNNVPSKWISVKDRLPENKKCVLLHSADGGVAEGVYDEAEKRWIQWRWSVLYVPQVTHWMPLPQPPKGE